MGAGVALLIVAVVAATRVADTREGLIAEVVTLLGGLAGIGLLMYGLVARPGQPARVDATAQATTPSGQAVRPAKQLVLGIGGIVLSLVLVGCLAISGGIVWAAFGLVLLLPMMAGSVFLCVRFLRAAKRDQS